MRVALANVLEKIPREILESEDGKFLQSVTDRNVYQIVHLIYRSKNYEVQSKDYEFSRNSMIDHWNAGYTTRSARCAIRKRCNGRPIRPGSPHSTSPSSAANDGNVIPPRLQIRRSTA